MKNRFNLIILICLIILFSIFESCVNLNTSGDQAGLITGNASNITDSTAMLNASINPYFVPQVTMMAFDFGTTTSYGLSVNAYQSSTLNIGYLSADLTGLTPSTTYHYRVKISATDSGSDQSFTTAEKGNKGIQFNTNLTYGTVTDMSGNIYKTIMIGTQTWMAENLRTSRFTDGTVMNLITDGPLWETSIEPAYCWYNNDIAIYKPIYGALYNWYAVNTGKLCPDGWRVPTDDDWTALTTSLGADDIAGIKLTEAGTAHWQMFTGASNDSGFTGLPGGSITDGLFYNIGWAGEWWTSSASGSINAWDREMIHINSGGIARNQAVKSTGLSVRCIKN
jgi:uncharacterized protein (TIGR02145 family)